MIRLSAGAERQVADLLEYYARLERPEAGRNLIGAIDEALERIQREPGAGIAAPRPYPALARPDRAWVKAGRYWIVYRATGPLVVLGVFYDRADIPRRL